LQDAETHAVALHFAAVHPLDFVVVNGIEGFSPHDETA
jgi:hypothetical protein